MKPKNKTKFSVIVLLTGLLLSRLTLAREIDPRRTPIVEAVEKVAPAVVNISTEKIVQRQLNPFSGYGFFFGDYFQNFFNSSPRTYKRESLGSGVLIDPKGYIITNEHVILPASKIKVVLIDGGEFEGKLIGSDSKFDLAVIRIEGTFPAVEVGKSVDLMIGETVIAIGNPFGLSHSVTTGVISALNRSIVTEGKRIYNDFIQTDASINPGNSGGPLLNILGELIGINTAIYQKAEGIGFAIPIDKVRRIIDDLIRYGYVHQAWIGIGIQEISRQLANYFQLPRAEGIIINRVVRKSPAEAARMRRGDVVTEIDGKPIKTRNDYEMIISGFTAGDEIKFTLLREGKKETVMVRAVDLPDSFIWEWLGLTVKKITPEMTRKFSLYVDQGVMIENTAENSPAQKTGLKPGDVIWQINDQVIKDKKDFKIAVHTASQRDRGSIILRIIRGAYRYYAIIEP